MVTLGRESESQAIVNVRRDNPRDIIKKIKTLFDDKNAAEDKNDNQFVGIVLHSVTH